MFGQGPDGFGPKDVLAKRFEVLVANSGDLSAYRGPVVTIYGVHCGVFLSRSYLADFLDSSIRQG